MTQERARVRARLADVAAAAGTSKPIASRILNDDPTLTVGEELRRRVLDAARELGYRPHAAARSLRRAATGALGLLVPALGNPVYTQLMRGAFRRAGELGFTVVLAEDFEEQEAGELFARLVLEGRIDALMIGSIRVDHPLLPLLAERPVPHVFVNRGVSRSGRNVVMNDARAVELAVGHLVSLGHRSLVHLAGPPGLDPAERGQPGARRAERRLGAGPDRARRALGARARGQPAGRVLGSTAHGRPHAAGRARRGGGDRARRPDPDRGVAGRPRRRRPAARSARLHCSSSHEARAGLRPAIRWSRSARSAFSGICPRTRSPRYRGFAPIRGTAPAQPLIERGEGAC
jgi:DNA-binding LacI/PurR family transcriptional regulator